MKNVKPKVKVKVKDYIEWYFNEQMLKKTTHEAFEQLKKTGKYILDIRKTFENDTCYIPTHITELKGNTERIEFYPDECELVFED